jgi:hypothetical protein
MDLDCRMETTIARPLEIRKGVAAMHCARRPAKLSLAAILTSCAALLLVFPALADDTILTSDVTDPVEFDRIQESAETGFVYPVTSTCKPPIWVGGVEATFLAPIISGKTVETGILDVGAANAVGVIDDIGIETMTFAPRVWLGIDNDGWGLVSRFWYLNDTQYASDNIPFGPDEFEFEGQNRLKLYTIDLEMTRSFRVYDCMLQATFGARYASFQYLSTLEQDAAFGTTLAVAGALSSRSFDGTGLTFSLNGRHPLWRNSSLHWIWNARGSAIFGNAGYKVAAENQLLDANGWVVAELGQRADFNDTLLIAELQTGLQWELSLQTIPATAFFRILCEYQYWGGVNDVELGIQNITVGSTAEIGSAAYARGINLDLIGFSVGAGFTW